MYEGEFNESKAHGLGKYYRYNGFIWYEGEFTDDNFNGYGKSYYEDGSIRYKGEFKDGKYNGLGKYYYDNGLIMYEGEFNEDKSHGFGKYYHDNGSIWYKGEFKDEIKKQEIKVEDLCLICMSEKKNMAFIPCGHLSMCERCSEKYDDDKCIMCRKEFSISYKIYS